MHVVAVIHTITCSGPPCSDVRMPSFTY